VAEEQQDPVMARIVEVVGLALAGDGDAARPRFAELWDEVGPKGDPLHRCTLAHHAADVQADAKAELMWDLRALAAADEVTDERAQRYHGSLSVAGFYPSLHLNLADVYRRLGDQDRARKHIGCAQEAVGALGDDGYGRMIREGIARAAARLVAEPGGRDGGVEPCTRGDNIE
jgi:hypothetical protein